jgi:hypothetical protein
VSETTKGETRRNRAVCAMVVAVMTAACSSRVVDSADSWRSGLDTARAAVAAGEPSAAARAWREAYGAAVRTRRWEPMLAVGDAALEVVCTAGDEPDARQQARQSYLVAVIVAEQQRSVDGLLRSAEAFARLGDRAVTEQTFAIARRLAGARANAHARSTAVETSIAADMQPAGSPAGPETLTP